MGKSNQAVSKRADYFFMGLLFYLEEGGSIFPRNTGEVPVD
jgi:hypothetical protein